VGESGSREEALPPFRAGTLPCLGWPRRRVALAVLVVAVALMWTVGLDVMTPAFDARTYRWDSAIYLDMADRGVRGNEGLVAPFAYRFVAPLLARRLSRWLPLSIDDGFRIVTYTGIVAELVLVFALARLVASSTRAAFVVMAVAGLSLFNVRFLLFDPYRPDALAFPITLASIWLLLSGRPGLAGLLAAAGLLVREFLLAPLGAALDAMVRRPGPVTRHLRAVAVPVALAVATVVLPRVLVPVRQNVAVTDPFRADLLWTLLTEPLSVRRDINIVFCLAGYFLPLLALGGRGRLRRAWASLGEARRIVVITAALTLALTLYGGSDIARFVAYFVAVQTIVLAAVLREGAPRIEIGLTLIAVAVFNRLYILTVQMEPIDRYLDFYAGYADRINAATAWRALELTGWVVAVRLVGMIMAQSAGPAGTRVGSS
jgi:hypothetical protein